MPYADPHKQKAFLQFWKKELREWFWGIQRGERCARCGFSHPAALQFHHPDGRKGDTVSRMVNKNVSREKILAEIALCECLCANCHAIEHFSQFDPIA